MQSCQSLHGVVEVQPPSREAQQEAVHRSAHFLAQGIAQAGRACQTDSVLAHDARLPISPPSLHDTQPFCLPLSCPAVAFQAQTACIQLWLPVGLAQLEKSIAQRLQAAASMLLGQPAPDADSTVQLHPTSMPASAPAPISNPAQPKQPVSSSLNEADAQAAQRLCSQVHACLSLQFEYAAQRMHVIWGMHATASAGCMAHVTISCTCQRSCLRLCLPW